MKVCVIGLGFIGLPTACLLARKHRVVGVDVDAKRVALANKGKPPFEEKNLAAEIARAHRNKSFSAAKKLPELGKGDAVVICVPTPLHNKKFDSRFLESACRSVAKRLSRGVLVIIESTVSPGTTAGLVKRILERGSGLRAGRDFFLAHCPERAIPGHTFEEMVSNDRVIGGFNAESARRAAALYRSFVRGKIFLTGCGTSEVVKLAENIYRDVNIALANELAAACEKIGVNAFQATQLANKHPRVRLHEPGAGVGGHCIPLDSWFLFDSVGQTPLLRLARRVNDSMPLRLAELTRKTVAAQGRAFKGAKIVILGIAYKPDVGDARETPARPLVNELKRFGARVVAVDPFFKRSEVGFVRLEAFGNAVKNADGLVLVTAHSAFKKIDWRLAARAMRTKIFVDGRGFFAFRAPPRGFVFAGIGRGDEA